MSSDQKETTLWKEEPLSPNGTDDGTSPSGSDEEWLIFDENHILIGDDDEEFTFYDDKLTRAQVVTKCLEKLNSDDWIKEESFPFSWLDEKIEDLPLFDGLSAPGCSQNRLNNLHPLTSKPHHQIIAQSAAYISVPAGHPQSASFLPQVHSVDPTQYLLREFESVQDNVEACHQVGVVSPLTPPQSPSSKVQQQLLITLQPLSQSQSAGLYNQGHHQSLAESIAVVPLIRQQPQQHHQSPPQCSNQTLPLSSSNEQRIAPPSQINEQWSAENLSLEPLSSQPSEDVAQELAKVDEYLRHCAENACATSNCSSSIDSSSAPASPITSSNASCTSSEDSEDPDWSVETIASTSRGRARRPASRASRKPYSRPNVEDKRSRKKEQNKNAATRYRQKKKQEIKIIIGEEQELVDKNEKLHGQVKDLQREIGYLKNLMRDLCKVKGLIK